MTALFEYILKCNLFLWSKLNFQYHYSSLQCHMILQKSFKYADLLLKKHFLHKKIYNKKHIIIIIINI